MRWEHFQAAEFDSPDEPGSGARMDPTFMGKLDQAREIAGVPFVITSGVRTPAANQAAGGVSDSAHLRGLAADIATPDSRHRWRILFGLIRAGFTRIGIGPAFIHVDDDPTKAPRVCWTY